MTTDEEGDGRAHEPLFNAPWPSLLAVAAIVGSYAWQSAVMSDDAAALAMGFAPADLGLGRWGRLFSMMFVHAGWTHAIMNALGALAFGPPVARLFGTQFRGAALFILFYLACGVLANLGYAAVHPGAAVPVVGASGAVSGLMGAATRLFGRERGLSPILSQPVLSLGGGWVAVNLLLALFNVTPLMPGARIAWEAHVAGLLAGLLLIGPFWRLSR
jgi:membrane associated rhomboid family serine protease